MKHGMRITPTDLNEPIDPADRFAYGWRYVTKKRKDGTEITEQVPLSLEDILHPQEEDFRVLSDPHWQDAFYLYGAFTSALGDMPGAQVLGDCRIAWDRKGEYAHGPDIAVIFKVRAKKRWTTFNVVKEKTRPALIVEVTSPSTRSTDLVNKVREYAEQRVPHYVIADAHEREDFRNVTLLDYHLSSDSNGYFTLPPNEEGRVWLPEVNLWLGVEDGRLVCFDVKGSRLGTTAEERKARLKAEHVAAAARQARLDAERVAASARQARLDAEQAAQAATTRLREMEEELQRLRPKKNGTSKNGASS